MEIPRLEYFGDFGLVGAESTIDGALEVFAASNEIIGFELKIGKSQLCATFEFLGGRSTYPLRW